MCTKCTQLHPLAEVGEEGGDAPGVSPLLVRRSALRSRLSGAAIDPFEGAFTSGKSPPQNDGCREMIALRDV